MQTPTIIYYSKKKLKLPEPKYIKENHVRNAEITYDIFPTNVLNVGKKLQYGYRNVNMIGKKFKFFMMREIVGEILKRALVVLVQQFPRQLNPVD